MPNSLNELSDRMFILASDIARLESNLRSKKIQAGYLAKHANSLGMTVTEMSFIFGVSRNTLYKWMKEIEG